MPRQNEGVDVKVRLSGEEEGQELTLYEHCSVKQFLRTVCYMQPERERRYRVILVYDDDDGRLEVIQNEEEVFGDRIVSCKELLLEPIESANNGTRDCGKLKDGKKPYLWFYQLPEATQCKVINDRDVALIALCLGELKPNLMLRLGFTYGKIEAAISDAKGQDTNWYTFLLLKWIQSETHHATFKVLFEEMRKIEDAHHGAYDWEKIKNVILDQ